jgi:hypothetical protein
MFDGSTHSSQGERVRALFGVKTGGCLVLAVRGVFLEKISILLLGSGSSCLLCLLS